MYSQQDSFNYSADYFDNFAPEPVPIKFPKPDIPPPVPSKDGSVGSQSIHRSFEEKLNAERDRYHEPPVPTTARFLNNLEEEREKRDLLQVLQEHLESEKEAGRQRSARQENMLNKLLDDAERTERMMEARQAAKAAEAHVRSYRLELEYAKAELERTRQMLNESETEKAFANQRAARIMDGARRLQLDLVRHEGLQRGKAQGIRDGYRMVMVERGLLPNTLDRPSAYIEDVPDEAASINTLTVRPTRQQSLATDWEYRRRDEPRSQPRSSTQDDHRTQSQSRPSRSQTARSAPSEHLARSVSSHTPSVDKVVSHPVRMTPFRKLSDIPEASNSGTPVSHQFVRSPDVVNATPSQVARLMTSPLRHHTEAATPVASSSRHTLDHAYPFRSPSAPPQSLSKVVHELQRNETPKPRTIPPPDTTPRASSAVGLPHSVQGTPSVVPRTLTTSRPPSVQGFKPPKAMSPPSHVLPVTIPPIPIPENKALEERHPLPTSIPYRDFKPPILEVEGNRIPESEPDTGTMTPLSVDFLSSFPRAEKEFSSRLTAIAEGGSIRSGSVTPSPLPDIREPNSVVDEWRRSSSTEATPQFYPPNLQALNPNMLQPPGQLERRTSSGSRSTNSIDINIEPPSRPPSIIMDPTSQASGFLSPNHTPQTLPAEPPTGNEGPVIPPTSDYDESDSDSGFGGLPPGFVPAVTVKPPTEPTNQTPKMIPSNNWGQHSGWGNGGSGSGLGGWPSGPVARAPSSASQVQGQTSSSGGSRTPRPGYDVTATPPGFTYPLPPGRSASNSAGYPLPGSARHVMASSASSSSSDSSDSEATSRSNTPISSRRSSGTPAPAAQIRSLQGGVLGSNSLRAGESPPDATTYMNTLANSATGTPRFGKSPRAMAPSPYLGPKSLYS